MTTAKMKVVKERLSVLRLAEVLNNVLEACRRRWMCRPHFYELTRLFQTHGLEEVKDLPPIHKMPPQGTLKEVCIHIIA